MGNLKLAKAILLKQYLSESIYYEFKFITVEIRALFSCTYDFIFLQVLFNLASQYAANEMYAEALNTYQVIVKNKMFNNGGRLCTKIN